MNKRDRVFLLFLLFAVAAAGSGYFLGKFVKPVLKSGGLGSGFVQILILTLWLAIICHELGHAIGGWLSGFRLHLFAAGPLWVGRVGGRLKWGLNRSLGMWGGVAASMPDSTAIDGRLQEEMLRMVAGGPVASLTGGLLALPAAMLWPENPRLAAALFTFAAMSAFLGIGTLLPISNFGFVNDGLRILQLWRRDRAGLRWMANVTLCALAASVRPREWPLDLVKQDADDETYDGVLAMWLRYSWHLDRKEVADAKSWLERALGNLAALAPPARPSIHASAADFYSRIEPDIERARRHLQEALKPGMVSKEALALAEASVLLLEGEREEAMEAVAEGRAVLDALTGSSRESMVEILDAIEARVRG